MSEKIIGMVIYIYHEYNLLFSKIGDGNQFYYVCVTNFYECLIFIFWF